MERELRALLIAGLSDMPAARVSWGEHHADLASAYVVLHLISTREGRTQQGPDGLLQGRVQVDCYAPTYAGANALGKRVKDVLDFYRGGGFRAILFDEMRQTREGGAGSLDGGANGGEALHRASLDFLTSWRDDNA